LVPFDLPHTYDNSIEAAGHISHPAASVYVGARPCGVILRVMASPLPIAHVSHWLWVLYLPPVLIVLGSIVRSTLAERRADRDGSRGSR
jgi:hypothetical protein